MESLFLQKITHNGEELPQALVITATFIEGIKLNAPKLIINFADQDNDITDTFKVTNGSELVVTMGDVSVESGDSFEESFIVLAPPKKVGDTVLVEALQKDVYTLKLHLNTPKFFVDKSPSQILKALMPNKKTNVLGVVGRGTFHIHNSITPSMMLEQMAKELGAVVYYSRGEFYVVSHNYIKRKAQDLAYEYSNPQAENIIYGITTPFSNNLMQRHTVRDYQMWHENTGIIKSGAAATRESLTSVGKDRLATLNSMVLPIMISHCAGTTAIKPITKIGFTLHRFNEELLVNESLPDEQIAIEVKHHQQGYKYFCQITTGVLSE